MFLRPGPALSVPAIWQVANAGGDDIHAHASRGGGGGKHGTGWGGEIKELHAAVPMRARREAAGTWATPSSQPRITSCLPITNLKGLFLSREESNFFPSSSIPGERKEGGKGGGEG